MKKYLGMEFRLITLSLLIMIVSIVSILIVAKARTDNMVDQQIQNTNKLILSSLDWAVSPLLEAGDIDSIQRLIENIGASSAIDFLRVYNRDFTILASSNPKEINLQEPNTVVDEIFSGGKLVASSSVHNESHQVFAIPVRGKSYDNRTKTDITAAVLISANTAYYVDIYTSLLTVINQTALFLALGLSLFSYFFIRKTITIPLGQLMHVVSEVEGGNYSPIIKVKGPNEFKRFADLFGSMLQEIREKNNSLREYSEMLEKKVEHRTAELQKSLEELKSAQKTIIHQEKMASIGKLAAGVAHEINNPTGFVIGNIVTLREYVDIFLIFYKETTELIGHIRELFDPNNKGEDGGILKAQINKIVSTLDELRVNEDMTYIVEDIIPLLTEVDRGTERIKNIVQDLRDFSREDKNVFEKADIITGIENSIKIVWNKIKYKATLVKELDPLPEVECNLLQLEQVFVNLLANAADAIVKNGEIRIRSRQINSHVEIIFSDNGSGMSPETSKQIFDPFYTTKEVGRGTGLGLSVSLGIIEKHGGTIKVASKPEKGTNFIISLPINQETLNES